ncbi:MFS transporter [Bacillus infantis]|uniref:MFS transporter n=1 Tax=Bacillus infantis TaxID=324767 RepID=A0A5D4SAD7_9BACI|nr:MFS transporter [Bacillus infantis]TYS60563.1 MFS transporter [Bacillus infantis]
MADAAIEQTVDDKAVLWKNKQFVFLFTGTTISSLTFQIYTMVLPFLVYDITQSTLPMGTMRAIEYLPNILLGLFIGLLIDKTNKKSFLMFSVIFQIISITILIIFINNGISNVMYLYFLGFIVSSCGFSFGVAYNTTLPLLIEKQLLLAANSQIAFLNTLVSFVGPVLASYMIVTFEYDKSLIITLIGLCNLLLILLFTRIPQVDQNKKGKSTLWKDLAEGWSFLLSSKDILFLTIMILGINIATALTGAVFMFNALSINIEKVFIGYIISSSLLGSLLSTLYSKKLDKKISKGKLFIILTSIMSLAYLFFYISEGWVLLAIGMFISGFCITLVNIYYFTLRQSSTPKHLLGRVTGTTSMLMKLSVPIAYFLSGYFGQYLAIKNIFLSSFIVLIVLTLIGLKAKVHKL